MQPHERLDKWLEEKGWVELEEMIRYCEYDRAWAMKQIQTLRRWIQGGGPKTNKKDWKRFFSNNLSRHWDELPEDQKINDDNRPTPYV